MGFNQSRDLINYIERDGDTILCNACKKGRLEVIKILLEKGADPNFKDDYGNTPLMFAVKNGDAKIGYECAKLLIESGADVNLTNKYGETALHYATDSVDGYNLLLLHNANRNSRSSDCTIPTPLSKAIDKKFRIETITFLLEQGMTPVVEDGVLAIRHNNFELFQLLIKYGLNPKQKRLISWAAGMGDIRFIQACLQD